ERLDAHFRPSFSDEPQGAATRAGEPMARLMAVQVALARELPDYWQQFDAVRLDYAAERAVSRGEGRGLLRRLFGLGWAPSGQRPQVLEIIQGAIPSPVALDHRVADAG